jgi:hypothetical protein
MGEPMLSTAIDVALAKLCEPTDVGERLSILEQVVTYWHGPIHPEDGFTGKELEGFAIPYPLDWWYRWAGHRREIMSHQNILLDPNDLLVRDELLVFYAENQWCYEWATLFKGDDPPVFGRSNSNKPWEPEGMVLSEHLILACLFEATMCHSPYGASASWLESSRSVVSRRAGRSCTRCRTAVLTGSMATRSGSGPRPNTHYGSSKPTSTGAGSTWLFERW